MTIQAVRFIKTLRDGSTKPFVMEGADGCLYVIKGAVGSADTIVQTCEWIAYRLGSLLQLPVVPSVLFEIPQSLIDREPALRRRRIACGLYCGSRYLYPTVRKGLIPQFISRCQNIGDGPATILFDHWIANSDRTDNFANVLITTKGCRQYHLIDHHNAFYGLLWFGESGPSLQRVYWGKLYQAFVPHMDAERPFDEAYRRRFHSLSGDAIRQAVLPIPSEWGVPEGRLRDLAEYLNYSRGELLALMRRHRRHFPI